MAGNTNVSSLINSTTNNMQPSSYIDLSFLKIGGKEYNVEIPLLSTFTNDANTNSSIKQPKYSVLKKVLELINNDVLINGQRSKVIMITHTNTYTYTYA